MEAATHYQLWYDDEKGNRRRQWVPRRTGVHRSVEMFTEAGCTNFSVVAPTGLATDLTNPAQPYEKRERYGND